MLSEKMIDAALDAYNEFPCPENGSIGRCCNGDQMRATLEAALRAQADAQPVAKWRRNDLGQIEFTVLYDPYVVDEAELFLNPAPEAAQALSDEEIDRVLVNMGVDRAERVADAWERIRLAVRAVGAILTRASAATAPKALQVTQDIIDAITRYGDARVDGGNSAEAIGEVIRLLRDSAATVAEPSSEGEAWREWYGKGFENGYKAAQQQAEPVGDVPECDGSHDYAEIRDGARVCSACCPDESNSSEADALAMAFSAAYHALNEGQIGSQEFWNAGVEVARKLERAAQSGQRADWAQTAAARDVLAERERQVSAEGWTPEHDDKHANGQMAVAAGYYALACGFPHERDIGNGHLPNHWPWDAYWWKPRDHRNNLMRAGALILAEIERLDRAAAPPPAEQGGV